MADKLFVQEGRKVFKEVVPMVVGDDPRRTWPNCGWSRRTCARLWLHQANSNMNRADRRARAGPRSRARRQRRPCSTPTPTPLGAGSIIAFHKHSTICKAGDDGPDLLASAPAIRRGRCSWRRALKAPQSPTTESHPRSSRTRRLAAAWRQRRRRNAAPPHFQRPL